MLSELKAFLFRGDVVGLAVAVVIGGAFQKIIDSLVTDIINPLIGMIAGQPDFSSVKPGGVGVGSFLNAVINFAIVGVVLFMVIKAAQKKPEEVK